MQIETSKTGKLTDSGAVKISVIITAHNRRQYLTKALESVKKQTLEHNLFEIIVVKNFQDETLDFEFDNEGIIQIKAPMDSTIGWDLYNAIKISKGEIIAFLDDDDIYSPDKLKKVLFQFNSNKIGYLKHEVYFIDDNDKILVKRRRLNIIRSRIINGNKVISNIGKLNRAKFDFNLSSICIKREIFTENILKYILENVSASPDSFLGTIAINSSQDIYLLNEKLVGYRLNNSASKAIGRDSDSIDHLVNFWNKLLSVYKEFLKIANEPAKLFLYSRIYGQVIALQILILKFSPQSYEKYSKQYYPLHKCIIHSLKTRDILLLLDSLRLFRYIILAKNQ